MRPLRGREVVIVEAVRTPIGSGHPERGYYSHVHPNHLLGTCYTELLCRSRVDPLEVEDVIAGCVQQFGEQGANIARNAWLEQGLPIETAAATVDRQCGSAQSAVNLAAALIASGVADVMIGAGVEHMGHLPFAAATRTQTEFGSPFTPELLSRHDLVGQGLGAELIAEAWDISRVELEELAVRSHRLAHQATLEGRFEREVVPIGLPDPVAVGMGAGAGAGGGRPAATGRARMATTDQGIRPDTTLEALAALRPAFKPDGRVTAGTSSQISDGAAGLLLMDGERARELGVRPRARIVDQTSVGCDPVRMLEGPIPATAKILRRQGMSIADLDLIEVNEAFAPVVLAWAREHRPDMDRVNVNGGAIALGHPLGSSGARLITTLLHELERTDKELGLVTMCCGGGLGTATLIQRV